MKLLSGCGLALAIAFGSQCSALAQSVKVGAGSYLTAPKGSDKPPPPAPLRTEAMLKLAAPTNQWYSTLIFNPKPDAIFAHPLTVKTTPAGFEMALPSKQVLATERGDVEISYPHANALQFSPLAFEPGPAKLAKSSDWAIDIAMAQGADQLLATVAHASPYVYFQLSRGDVRLRLPSAGVRTETPADARVLALVVAGQNYAVFGPTGVRWERVSDSEWAGRLPAGKGYFSAAALPDTTAATVALFSRHAYAFVRDTRVDWRYDQAQSLVETSFKVTTQVMEGADNGPMLGLYPHQWFNNASVADKLGAAYDSVRGKIRLLAASQFKTSYRYTGFVPYWPAVKDHPRKAELAETIKSDLRRRRQLMPMLENADNWRTSAYWQGKGLTRATQLAAVVEQQGDKAGRDELLALAKARMEDWFSGQAARSYFSFDKGLGTVSGYPDEFFAVEQINDHHFHYGYWIRAAAEIAMRDPAWAAKDKWGGMVDLLVADIATAERGRADFPFLRNFDPYEGHSWANGLGGVGEYGALGNNQESSSEAINAWAGLILWGEVTGNRALRDLGIYLYTTEIQAINHYWFDMHGLVFAPEYKHVEASMVFGGKYAHNTWWTDEPRQIKGINLLPIGTFATHLGSDPRYVKRNVGTLPADTQQWLARGKSYNEVPKDIWQDIFAKYLALADPAAALAQWDRWGDVELGETRSHTLHWMLSLAELGTPDLTVSADTPLYQVFKQPDGRKNYLAFNAGKAPIVVRFSDGSTLSVLAGALGRSP